MEIDHEGMKVLTHPLDTKVVALAEKLDYMSLDSRLRNQLCLNGSSMSLTAHKINGTLGGTGKFTCPRLCLGLD